jgi:sulfite oxidase
MPDFEGLLVHQLTPLNAEAPLDRLRRSFVTACEQFYIRSHGPVPRLDASKHRVRVGGSVARPLELSLQDLRERFARHTVMATLQCAGNRRAELDRVKPVTGIKWGAGAIGNAEWTGAPLVDVLSAAGVGKNAHLHVAFASLDWVEIEQRRFTYGVSIPLTAAIQPDVLLAYDMNGRPLSPEHGAPVRVIVPGLIGARSAKWLSAVQVQQQPSDNYFQRYDYKLFPPDAEQDRVDWAEGLTLNDQPVNAVICQPADGVVLTAGTVDVRGYAFAGSRSIERVYLSADQGRTWTRAALERPADTPWAWTFWEAQLRLAAGEHELAVRAVDQAGQAQPANTHEVWNFKGYVNNAWHRVRLTLR